LEIGGQSTAPETAELKVDEKGLQKDALDLRAKKSLRFELVMLLWGSVFTVRRSASMKIEPEDLLVTIAHDGWVELVSTTGRKEVRDGKRSEKEFGRETSTLARIAEKQRTSLGTL
jgi:hypothetical protein